MPVSVLQAEHDKLFEKVQLRLKFRDRVMAGIPQGGSLLDYYLESKHMSEQEAKDFEARIESGELTDAEKEQIKNMSVCIFEKDFNGNLCLWHGNSKANMRDIFTTIGKNSIKPVREKGKECSGGKQTFQHAIHVNPTFLTFMRNGKAITEADGTVDKVKHITDMSGTRSAIGRHEYLVQPEVALELIWPRNGSVKESDLREVWAMAQEDGLGACRSQGHGKFDVIAWEKPAKQ